MRSHILSVSQLTALVKDLIEGSFPEVWVEGEISNLSVPQSGHAYFTLKDQRSQVRAVLFRSGVQHLKFTLQHGMLVICRARLGVYEPRGEYQLIVEYVEPKGVGALQKAFEELKARLEREGLFGDGRKKPLPELPRRIGIITSPTGAAIRDMLRVIRRRHPRMQILVYPVPVQGADAAPAIAEAIRYFNRERAVDVMIVGRGGGSLEDLWAFNEESVARAIFDSGIPVISAVGHETDYTIADFVADLRAPTPSAAAELVVRSEEHFRERIGSLRALLDIHLQQKIGMLRARLQGAAGRLTDPLRRLEQYSQRVDELLGRIETGMALHLRRDRTALAALAAGLDHLNPLGILARGYSVTRIMPSGVIVKRAADVRKGDRISTVLHAGKIASTVDSIEEG